jgi:hypothetical protein
MMRRRRNKTTGWWIIPALVFGVALWVALILFLLS